MVSPSAVSTPLRMLVLGGTRSGKSAYAESVVASHASSGSKHVHYVATGRRDPDDADWEHRIEVHRNRRPAAWTTSDAGKNLPSVLADSSDVTMVDDIGTWLTGALDDENAWDLPRGSIAPACDALVDAVAHSRCALVLVSPEVGWGVVPHTRSGRLFQDEMGLLNGRLAQVCDQVVLVVAGLPLPLKGTYGSDGPLVMKGRQ